MGRWYILDEYNKPVESTINEYVDWEEANPTKKAVKQEDLSAIIFWLKTRARWRTADKDDEKKKDSIIEALLEKIASDKS